MIIPIFWTNRAKLSISNMSDTDTHNRAVVCNTSVLSPVDTKFMHVFQGRWIWGLGGLVKCLKGTHAKGLSASFCC